MATVEAQPRVDYGLLAANGMMVQMLQSALAQTDLSASTLPELILNIHDQAAWREYCFADNPRQVFRWSSHQFREFIKAPRPVGCQSSISLLERMLRDTEAWGVFLDLTSCDSPGNPSWEDLPRSDEGRFISRITDNIRNTEDKESSAHDPDIIPIEDEKKKVRDRSNDLPGGTSVSSAWRRLNKAAETNPVADEFLGRVRRREMSLNRAMIELGFRLPQIQVPDDPIAAARRLGHHFKGDRLAALIESLQAILGAEP